MVERGGPPPYVIHCQVRDEQVILAESFVSEENMHSIFFIKKEGEEEEPTNDLGKKGGVVFL